MTNRAGSSSGENRNFLTTGLPPDRNWMAMKRIHPTWTGNETRNMMDSGIEFTENRYGPAPPSQGNENAMRTRIRCRYRIPMYLIV